MYENMVTRVPGLRYKDGKIDKIEDVIVIEQKIDLYLNGKKYLSMVASMDQLEELGAGFFTAAGIAHDIRSVCVKGKSVFVEAGSVAEIAGSLESAGGFDPGLPVGRVISNAKITPEEIFKIRETLNADVWNETGGLHCSVLYHDHKQAAISSDIGRHNTVDKVIGRMVLDKLDPSSCVLGCTGRQPSGMVVKAANAGIPIIVSRAASTLAGVCLAKESGITLICFTRDGRFTVYAHPERVIGLDKE